jgi:hypothetical protein
MDLQRHVPLPELFVLELLPRLFQSLVLGRRHLWVALVEAEYGGGRDVGDDGSGGALVVGRDDVPGAPAGVVIPQANFSPGWGAKQLDDVFTDHVCSACGCGLQLVVKVAFLAKRVRPLTHSRWADSRGARTTVARERG